VRIVYVGHATILVELDGTTLLTDPLLRSRVAHLTRTVSAAPLERVDAVLISHLHGDHLDFGSLKRLPREVPLVVPRGAGRALRFRTRRTIVELAVGDETEIGAVRVRAVRAEHSRGRYPVVWPVVPNGYVLSGAESVYFAGDTDLFPEMAELAPVDVALLPVSGWGPRLPAGHLGPAEAAEAARLVQPRVAIPIHWGTYRVMGLKSGGVEPAERFRDEVAKLAPEVEVRILQPGEATTV